jgi:hypothetical protein
MRFRADTLDDALLALYPALLADGTPVDASRGVNRELRGVLLEIA